MELSWSTFVLEIINFVVLVWILKRFFYAPVKRVIEERRRAIEDSIAQAEQKRAEAGELETQYQSRLARWDQEKQQAREVLQNDMAAERERLMADLHASLEKEEQKARVLGERRTAEFKRSAEQRALAQGGEFAARLLGRLAGPDVQDRLFDLLVEALSRLSDSEREALPTGVAAGRQAFKVTSAYPVKEEQRAVLEQALKQLLGGNVACEFTREPGLVAGFHINAGPLVLRANIRDELRFFSEASDAAAG